MKSIEEQIAFLENAEEDARLLKKLTEETNKVELEFKTSSRELESEQKAVEDSIELTIRKRKNELTKSFDQEINKADALLRRAKDQRATEKAKEQNARIKEETADINTEINKYVAMMKTAFKKDGAPAICNTRLFYILTTPITFFDVFLAFLFFAICFAGIPFLIIYLTNPTPYIVGVIYIADIIIFGFIYYTFFLRVKIRHLNAVMYGKNIRRKIYADKHHVNAITNSIKEDKNEDMYNLGGFDEQIADISADKDKVARTKQAALNDFERNIKPEITNEIIRINKDRINMLTEKRNNSKHRLDELSESLQNLSIKVARDYYTILGKDYDDEMISYLIAYLQTGQAKSITEAINLYKLGTKVDGAE